MVASRRKPSVRKPAPKSASVLGRLVKKVAKRPAKGAPKTKAVSAKAVGAKALPAKKTTAESKSKGAPAAKSRKPAADARPAKPLAKAVSPEARDVRPAAATSAAARPPSPAPAVMAAATNPSPRPAPVSKPAAPIAATVPAPIPVSASVPMGAAPAPLAPVAPPPPKPVPPPPVRRPLVTLTVVTRKSALAIAQTDLVLARFAHRIPNYAFRVFKLVTTGDRQAEWSLQQEGGKGLFTGELEQALTDHRADLAVHSAKDLPTDMPAGLALAGFLQREDPRDVLVIREDVGGRPTSIATGSPRRRMQLERQFQKASFMEIRGNVDTRLRKIAEERVADATVLAAAGLKRLGITEWPGLRFQPLPLAVSVPAVGQAAVAVQARTETANFLRPHLDEPTRVAVELERAFLRLMGGGCHTAFAVHYDGTGVHVFHESCGYQRFTVSLSDALEPVRVAERLLTQLKLRV